MDGLGHTQRARRVRILDGIYRYWLGRFALVATAVHAVVVLFLVTPSAEDGFGSAAREMSVFDMPPETRIPPPPEEIPRPATPVVGSEEVETEVTIAETDLVEGQAVPEPAPPSAPPVPAVEEEGRPTFAFTPYTVKPKCKAGCTPEALLRHVPPIARKPGFSCALTVGIRIDEGGRVTATDVLASSGVPLCDRSVQEWAMTTSWTTAYNRDQPVVVWIAQPVQVTSQ